jgi:hypothetical protein
MSIFSRKAAPPVEAPVVKGGGLDAIRARVRAHTRWPEAHAIMARELHISGSALDSFIAGTTDLTLAQIGGILDHLGIKAAYDPDTDLLRSTAPPATPFRGELPPPAVGRSLEDMIGPPHSAAWAAHGGKPYEKAKGWA